MASFAAASPFSPESLIWSCPEALSSLCISVVFMVTFRFLSVVLKAISIVSPFLTVVLFVVMVPVGVWVSMVVVTWLLGVLSSPVVSVVVIL